MLPYPVRGRYSSMIQLQTCAVAVLVETPSMVDTVALEQGGVVGAAGG